MFRYVRMAALLLLCAGTPTGGAYADDDCTWLPDIRCGRHGRFNGFVPPMSSPYNFEDPFITTSLNLAYVFNDLPESSVFEGGDIRVQAAQLRLALTDRLGLLATKDGRFEVRPDLDLLDTEVSYASLSVGLEYALIADPEAGFIVSPRIIYEPDQGSVDAFNGHGQGAWIPGVSTAFASGGMHFMGGVSARLPVDGDAEATPLFYNLHVDFQLTQRILPFIELNGIHYLDEGTGETQIRLGNGARLPLGTVQTVLGTGAFDGNDVVNLGSDGIEGNDIITMAIGTQVKLTERMTLGLAYERPVTRRRDLLKQRVSLMVMIEL